MVLTADHHLSTKTKRLARAQAFCHQVSGAGGCFLLSRSKVRELLSVGIGDQVRTLSHVKEVPGHAQLPY